jgi:hypothetical protein
MAVDMGRTEADGQKGAVKTARPGDVNFDALFRPAGSRARFYTYLILSVIVAILAMLHVRAFGVAWYPLDDAYIVAHNVQVLHAGRDINFPGVPAAAGSTSLIHLALVALVSKVVPVLGALYLVEWLCILAYVLGLARLAFVNGASVFEASLLTLVGALAGSVPWQLLNGVDTGLALAAVAWTLALLSEPPGSKLRTYGAPILCGLLPYVRPDLSALSLAAFGMLAIGRLRSEPDPCAALRGILADLAIAVAAALPWALWSLRDLGGLLPSTVAAKLYFHAEAAMPLDVKLRSAEARLWLFVCRIGPVALLALLLDLRPAGRAALLFCLIFVTVYALKYPSSILFNEFRYVVPLIPAVMLGGACAFRSRMALRGAVSAVLAITLLFVAIWAQDNWNEYRYCCSVWSGSNRGICLWCEENLPKDATVLIHDAGAISFYTHLHLVDLVGLKTPASVEAHRRFTYPSLGRRRGDAIDAIARQAHAGYFVVMDSFEKAWGLREGLLAHGWSVDPIKHDGDYTVYRLGEPVSQRPAVPPISRRMDPGSGAGPYVSSLRISLSTTGARYCAMRSSRRSASVSSSTMRRCSIFRKPSITAWSSRAIRGSK